MLFLLLASYGGNWNLIKHRKKSELWKPITLYLKSNVCCAKIFSSHILKSKIANGFVDVKLVNGFAKNSISGIG